MNDETEVAAILILGIVVGMLLGYLSFGYACRDSIFPLHYEDIHPIAGTMLLQCVDIPTKTEDGDIAL